MKIDLHVHTSDRSSCGKSTEEEQICAAIDAGLDGIAFTDHDRLVPLAHLHGLNDKYAPFRIFGGIEVTIWDRRQLGVIEHLLVLGVHDDMLENYHWSYPELHTFVRKRGGFIAVAHPFRFHSDIELELGGFPPDGIEAYSRNTPKHEERRILDLAQQLDAYLLSNSDAHHNKALGKYYNVLDRIPLNDQELVEILQSGKFTNVFPEPHPYKEFA